MFLCRVAWRRCGPLARASALRRVNLNRDVVPRRLMSSVPGGSGENWVYVILCGGVFTGAMAYAYSTVSSDSARFNDRMNNIQSRPKKEWQPKPWPPKGEDVEEAMEAVSEEAGLVQLDAEVSNAEGAPAETAVETVAEAVAEAADVVASVATVIEETAEEVAAVAQEVKVIAEKVETAAEAFEAPKLLVKETTGVEEQATTALEEPTAESNVTTVTGEASVEPATPITLEKKNIPLATEVIPIVLAEELPVITEHLSAFEGQAEADAPTPAKTAALPAGVEDPAQAPKPEYTVVILEGSLKDKKRTVLGASPKTRSIIPDP